MITVQIIYALPHQVTIIDYSTENSCSVLDAIIQSQILSQCEIIIDNHSVGIYGKKCELSDMIKDGDRIEIYRSLINDPKEIRRKRAEKRLISKEKT